MSSVQQRLSFGEMPSEMFEEHALYFGEERYHSRKIPIFVGTSKSFQNIAEFEENLSQNTEFWQFLCGTTEFSTPTGRGFSRK